MNSLEDANSSTFFLTWHWVLSVPSVAVSGSSVVRVCSVLLVSVTLPQLLQSRVNNLLSNERATYNVTFTFNI